MKNIFKLLFSNKKEDTERLSYLNIDREILSNDTKDSLQNLQQFKNINSSKAKKIEFISKIVDETTNRYIKKNEDLLNQFRQREYPPKS